MYVGKEKMASNVPFTVILICYIWPATLGNNSAIGFAKVIHFDETFNGKIGLQNSTQEIDVL
jgi:hypothetical protein